jgi:TetR/AcrR family transcriptional regulator, repressor for uid operon
VTETTSVAAEDPVRAQLLEAAGRVFARKGFAGTKIQDIVREAGLSTGAVYGRFASKDELLREAVTAMSARVGHLGDGGRRVADLIRRGATLTDAALSADEAVRLEAFVAARREPDVAAALAEAQAGWREAIQPLVDAAVVDGTVAGDVDPEAVLFFVRTLNLGLLLQRAAGITRPEPSSWAALVDRIVASFGDHNPNPLQGDASA